MKRSKLPLVPIVITFAVVGLVSFGLFYGYGNMKSDTVASAQPASCPEPETCIALQGRTASPDIVTVKAGSFVQFVSADGSKHNIALEHAAVQHEDHSEYESGEFGGDEAWRVQFKKDGAYTFRDKHHPGLKVSVIVYTPGKDYKVE